MGLVALALGCSSSAKVPLDGPAPADGAGGSVDGRAGDDAAAKPEAPLAREAGGGDVASDPPAPDAPVVDAPAAVDRPLAIDTIAAADTSPPPPLRPNGAACEGAAQCTSGFCVGAPGICCDRSCESPCGSCATGACVAVGEGRACGPKECGGPPVPRYDNPTYPDQTNLRCVATVGRCLGGICVIKSFDCCSIICRNSVTPPPGRQRTCRGGCFPEKLDLTWRPERTGDPGDDPCVCAETGPLCDPGQRCVFGAGCQ